MNTLNLPLKARGSPTLPLRMEIAGAIELADLPRAHTRTFVPKPLEEMKSIHHHMAELIAAGRTQREVAKMLGRSENRISVLMLTPSFRQLVEDKRREISERRAEVIDEDFNRTERNTILAQDILHERMEDRPDEISTSQLIAIIADGTDRIGPMKRQGSLNVNFDLAERMEIARKALGGPKVERLTDDSGMAGRSK